MIATIDADLVAFISAAASENENEGIARYRTNTFVEKILEETGADGYELYFSGPNNFRYQVFPEYKRQRADVPKPIHYKACKQFLKEDWNAIEFRLEIEADDAMGIMQNEHTICCSIDKDMDMIPGWHYSWAIWRLGKEVRPAKKYYVTPEKALYNFYHQLLIGDPSDGIKGAVGIGKTKAKGILQGCKSHMEYIQACRPYFSCDEEMEMNAKVLWIWQKYPDNIIDRWKEAGYQTEVIESEGENRATDSA